MESSLPNTNLDADDSSSFAPSRYVVHDLNGVLQIFDDGTVVRGKPPVFHFPIADDPTVCYTDFLFHPHNSLSLRLYSPAFSGPELPVLYYFRGGGFCVGSRTWANFHNFCVRLASSVPAIVVAPDYRLAPEHPLPAAIDDAVTALTWLQSQAVSVGSEPSLDRADFNRVFIIGDSSGGNLAHHMAVRFGSCQEESGQELKPVKIAGYILLMPFFGGTERTKSERECPAEAFLNLELSDLFWKIALAGKRSLDDPIVNPLGSAGLGGARFGRLMVVVGEKDLLRDRAVEYAERAEGMGMDVQLVEYAGQEHAFFTLQPESSAAGELVQAVKRFVSSSFSTTSLHTGVWAK